MRATIKSLKHFPDNRIILADVKRLKASIKAEGLDEAIKVAQLSDDAPKKFKLKAGDLVILWGHHRTVAETELGKKTIEAEVSIMSWDEAEAEYWREKVWPRTKNRSRYEFALHLKGIVDAEGRRPGPGNVASSNKQIANRYGETEWAVKTLLSMANAKRDVNSALQQIQAGTSLNYWFTETHFSETAGLEEYPELRAELIQESLALGSVKASSRKIRARAKEMLKRRQADEQLELEKKQAAEKGDKEEVAVLKQIQEKMKAGETREKAEKAVARGLQDKEDEAEAEDASAFDWQLVPSVAKIVQDMIATEKRLPDWERASAIGKMDQVARAFVANRIRSYVKNLNALARALEKREQDA